MKMEQIKEAMEIADRWSYDPFKKVLVFFWWKEVSDEGVLYKAKQWISDVSLKEFWTTARDWENFKRLRWDWYKDEWQFENGCCLDED